MPDQTLEEKIISRDGTFKLLGSLGIDSAQLNRLAARHDDPISARFLAPLTVLKFQHWSIWITAPLIIELAKTHYWAQWGGGGGKEVIEVFKIISCKDKA